MLTRTAARKILAYWLKYHYVPDSFRKYFWYSTAYDSFWPSSQLINTAR